MFVNIIMLTAFLLKKSQAVIKRKLCRHIVSASSFQINRAIVLSKVTRYEVEKAFHPKLTEKELETLIKSRGSNYESLLEHHQRHKDYEKYVLDSLKEMGITTKLLTRWDYTDSWIESVDVVFPVGGDGTFLLAASKVRDNQIPVVGFNSDPNHSEGFLCLDKKYSYSIKDVLQRLKEGSFSWLFRTRIRVLLKSLNVEPQETFQDKKHLGPHRVRLDECFKKKMSSLTQSQIKNQSSSTASTLALNEVFVGESLSAQVSYFEMQLPPSQDTFRVKSSGLCISTGTGSTSWHLSINRVTEQGVAHILRCAGLSPTPTQCRTVADQYNKSLLFDPEHMEMCYTVRDLICAGVWPSPRGLEPRGFADSLWVRSRCRDARLVIDGGTSFIFNDGSEARFELHSEDALRTVIL